MHRRLSIVFLMLTTACSIGVAKAGVPSTPAPVTVTEPTTTTSDTIAGERTPASSTTTTTTTTTLPTLSTASIAPHETLAARSDAELTVYGGPLPLKPLLTLEPTTILGTPTVVRVLEGPVNGWLRVSLPVRPNGTTGWVEERDVTLFKVDRSVVVDLSDRRLVVSNGDGVLLETSVAVGSPTSPTPTGSFFVTDSVITGNDNGPWGPWAFGLSARSDVITEFNGGDGIIGIHGTNRPDSIGSAASLGCVRVPNEVAIDLSELLSAGVPVEIRE